MFQEEQAKGFDADEDLLGDEVDVKAESYLWQDKFRPRKPRYVVGLVPLPSAHLPVV